MALKDLWKNDRSNLESKNVRQLIAFAGDGKLADGIPTSTEFRDLLAEVDSRKLGDFISYCLTDEKFDDRGFALQDICNEMGERLGFSVKRGNYKGRKNSNGFDGLWSDKNANSIVVEVKTSDTYQIKLDTVARYRKTLTTDGIISEEKSSILIVVGRNDTYDLEAQVRGSRHAWDIRIVSVEGLLRLLKISESIDEAETQERIRSILIPHEYTKIDGIIELAFSAANDAAEKDFLSPSEDDGEPSDPYETVADKVNRFFGTNLIRLNRSRWKNTLDGTQYLILISKNYIARGGIRLWYGVHPSHIQAIKDFGGEIIFASKEDELMFRISLSTFESLKNTLHMTSKDDGSYYWHVKIEKSGKKFFIRTRKGFEDFEILPTIDRSDYA